MASVELADTEGEGGVRLANGDYAMAAFRYLVGIAMTVLLGVQACGAAYTPLDLRYPAARFSLVSPISRRRVYDATQLLFGRALEPQYDIGRARVILSLGADFLSAMPMSVRWARQFAGARRAATPDADMNRLYVLEPMPTPTGSAAEPTGT